MHRGAIAPHPAAGTGHFAAESLQQLVDSLPDAVILLDEDWRIVYANASACAISQYTPEHFHSLPIWELYPALVGTSLEHTYREAVATREERIIPDFFYAPRGKWSHIRAVPTSSGLVLHYRDITQVKTAEAARDSALGGLQQVLEATTDSIIRLARDWRIVYQNPQAEAITAPAGNVIGRTIWESFPETTDPRQPYLEAYHGAMEQGITGEFEVFYGEPLNIWVRTVARPAEDGIILFFRDITDHKRTIDAFIRSEKLAAVGRLASSIAHEINNPLEAVTNLLYLLRDAVAWDPQAAAHLDLAEQELRRISIITTQTLRFHKQPSRPTEIGCADLFSSALSVSEGKLRNARIQVDRRKRAQRCILCFEGEIRQVLNNLVGNAIDAMPTGGRLFVRSREATDWRSGRSGLMLTVADTGTGMSAATQAHIFEAFYTTKGISGTGLGLWISSEIVTRHGGHLRIRSSQNPTRHGTVATLFLPSAPPTTGSSS